MYKKRETTRIKSAATDTASERSEQKARELELTREQTLKPNLNLWCRFVIYTCVRTVKSINLTNLVFLVVLFFSLFRRLRSQRVGCCYTVWGTWSWTESVYVFLKQIFFDFICFFFSFGFHIRSFDKYLFSTDTPSPLNAIVDINFCVTGTHTLRVLPMLSK